MVVPPRDTQAPQISFMRLSAANTPAKGNEEEREDQEDEGSDNDG